MVLQIRQQEISARKSIAANPVKMDAIKKEVAQLKAAAEAAKAARRAEKAARKEAKREKKAGRKAEKAQAKAGVGIPVQSPAAWLCLSGWWTHGNEVHARMTGIFSMFEKVSSAALGSGLCMVLLVTGGQLMSYHGMAAGGATGRDAAAGRPRQRARRAAAQAPPLRLA